MNHPRDDQWLAYLDGEASPQVSAQLETHLQSCAECAREVAGWRRSIQSLRQAAKIRSSPAWWAPAIPWAAAAALVALGFVVGRWTNSSQQAIQAALSAELRQQQQIISQEISERVTRSLNENRSAEHQTMLKLVAELQQQRSADYLSLRQDLETVAAMADARLRQADYQLHKMIAKTQLTDTP